MNIPHGLKNENEMPETLLALDIGTEYIKAVIAERQEGDNLIIRGVGKEHQAMGNMYAGAIADIPAVIAACERALSRAENMAGVVAKTCSVGIAGELIKGNTKTVRYRRKDGNKPISDQEMQLIIKRVQDKAEEQAREEVALETDNPDVEVRLINSAIVSLSIDGYKVSNPIGFKGSELVLQFYTAFAPLVHISAIEKVCAELNLDLVAVAVEPFAVCRACLGNNLDSNLSSFDTSKVTRMQAMFYGMRNLTTLNLSNFDTSQVTNMSLMFYNMSNLITLNLSNFNTSQVTNMYAMFYGMSSLTTLDLSNFDTSKVTNMDSMFSLHDSEKLSDKLEKIYVNNDFNTTKLTNFSGMFRNRNKLRGGNGSYLANPSTADKTWLRVDRPGVQGYFTRKP